MNRSFLFLSMIISFLISCHNREDSYPYADGLKVYLQEEINVDLQSEEFSNIENLFLINVDGCGMCVDISLKLLVENQYENSLIVLSGQSVYQERVGLVEILSTRDNVYTDISTEILSYRRGVQTPYYFKIDQGFIIDYIKLDRVKWSKLSPKLL